MKTFEEVFEECSYEVQSRFNYLSTQLDECANELLEITKKLEENKVEIELAKSINSEFDNIRLLKWSRRMLKDRLDYLEQRYSELESLYDDTFEKIMA